MPTFMYKLVKTNEILTAVWLQENAADLESCYTATADGIAIGVVCLVKRTSRYVAYDPAIDRLLNRGEWMSLDNATAALHLNRLRTKR